LLTVRSFFKEFLRIAKVLKTLGLSKLDAVLAKWSFQQVANQQATLLLGSYHFRPFEVKN
jgi:hypothetical protein